MPWGFLKGTIAGSNGSGMRNGDVQKSDFLRISAGKQRCDVFPANSCNLRPTTKRNWIQPMVSNALHQQRILTPQTGPVLSPVISEISQAKPRLPTAAAPGWCFHTNWSHPQRNPPPQKNHRNFASRKSIPSFPYEKPYLKKNGGCWWSGLIVGANGFEVFHQRIASSFPHVHVHHVMIIFGTASHLRLGTQLEKKNMVKDSVTQQCGI